MHIIASQDSSSSVDDADEHAEHDGTSSCDGDTVTVTHTAGLDDNASPTGEIACFSAEHKLRIHCVCSHCVKLYCFLQMPSLVVQSLQLLATMPTVRECVCVLVVVMT